MTAVPDPIAALPDTLVLGAGGTLGEAWMRGLLSGLSAASGLDFRDCEYVMGTSAGSIVAAPLVSGHELGAGGPGPRRRPGLLRGPVALRACADRRPRVRGRRGLEPRQPRRRPGRPGRPRALPGPDGRRRPAAAGDGSRAGGRGDGAGRARH